MKSPLLFILLISSLLLPLALSSDCYAWSVTKRAKYMEVVPTLLYYDHVDWINLDPTKSCSFKTYEASMVKRYSTDVVITYQKFLQNGMTCELDATVNSYN